MNNPVGDLERGKDFTQKVLSLDRNAHATISFLKNFSYKTHEMQLKKYYDFLLWVKEKIFSVVALIRLYTCNCNNP